jgi:hypothetical protein
MGGLYLEISRWYLALDNLPDDPVTKSSAMALPIFLAMVVVNVLLKLYLVFSYQNRLALHL